MTFIQLLLAFSSQTIRCDSAIPQRSITFLGSLYGDAKLAVTRDGRDFDPRRSQWIVTVFDVQEHPLTEFYVERIAERNIDWLAGAIYLPPNEYAEAAQPEITVYVWLPRTAFDSVWNASPALQSGLLRIVVDLTVPFRGSALNYSPAGPDNYDKVWNAEKENPLLLQSTEFYISPIKRSDTNVT
jgi:hypothetical protein